MSTVDVSFHLVVGQRIKEVHGRRHYDGKPSVRLAIRQPRLDPHEVAIRLDLHLPAGLFLRPALKAIIHIPDNQVPHRINAQVADNIAAVLQEQLGIVLQIQAPAQEQGQ